MEVEKSTLSSHYPDLHHLPGEFHEINTEFCEEGIVYTDFRVGCSSNIQERKQTRTWKIKVSPWCLAAVVFAFLYLIALVIAAFMIAKVRQQQEILNDMRDNTKKCEYIL
ncbi:uncharacterized protein ACIGJ3_007231 [Trichechus inunguis]